MYGRSDGGTLAMDGVRSGQRGFAPSNRGNRSFRPDWVTAGFDGSESESSDNTSSLRSASQVGAGRSSRGGRQGERILREDELRRMLLDLSTKLSSAPNDLSLAVRFGEALVRSAMVGAVNPSSYTTLSSEFTKALLTQRAIEATPVKRSQPSNLPGGNNSTAGGSMGIAAMLTRGNGEPAAALPPYDLLRDVDVDGDGVQVYATGPVLYRNTVPRVRLVWCLTNKAGERIGRNGLGEYYVAGP